MPPDKERIERERLAGLPLSKLIRELADMHIGDGDDVGVLARVLLERVDRLAWTTDEPTQSGWYWFRGNPGNAASEYSGPVQLDDCGQVQLVGIEGWWNRHHFNGEWAGPLEVPE